MAEAVVEEGGENEGMGGRRKTLTAPYCHPNGGGNEGGLQRPTASSAFPPRGLSAHNVTERRDCQNQRQSQRAALL